VHLESNLEGKTKDVWDEDERGIEVLRVGFSRSRK
jgi:hypothetical protein